MKKNIILPVLLTLSLALTGCASGTSTESNGKEPSYYKNLSNNTYYIKHSDNKCDPVYLGNASFDEGNITSQPNNERTVWYKNDWSKIPTLYEGESLIYYSTEELDEKFTFERFEDFGYTIGVRKLSISASNRYKIPTNPDLLATYPGGDTDEILNLTNENVILDSISGRELRAPENDEDEVSSPVTRCGTVKGLKQNSSYEIEVYDGTKGYSYVWTADVRVLGSMEVEETNDFVFESATVINIAIPESFNSGYYMINGVGIFRYVKGATAYDNNTDFNIPNHVDEELEDFTEDTNLGDISENGESSYDSVSKNTDETTDYKDDAAESTFEITELGTIYVTADLDIPEGDNASGITGIVESPEGKRFQLLKNNNSLSLTFNTEETGIYKIKIYGLNGKSANINVGYVEDGD